MTSDQAQAMLSSETFLALARRVLTGRCVLFLGAGASVDSGGPTAPQLADFLAEEVLMTSERGMALDVVAEYAIGYTGRPAVIEAIRRRLSGLAPDPNLRKLMALPWGAVYSVNFDTLAAEAMEAERPGVVRVFPRAMDLDTVRPGQVPLYMIHGSIRSPRSGGDDLVLTREDTRRAIADRQAFYRRLNADLQLNEIVYIGFQLADEDFRSVVQELHESISSIDLIPRGYAVTPHPPAFAAGFWDTKKISLLAGTLADFVSSIEHVAKTSARLVVPVAASPALPQFARSILPSSPLGVDLADAFEFPELDDGQADAQLFLRGGPATWPTIRDRFDAIRDVMDDVIAHLLIDEVHERNLRGSSLTKVTLVTGAAGSGKSTFGRRVAWELVHSWGRNVVWGKQADRVDLDVVEAAIRLSQDRLYVFVDSAADNGNGLVHLVERARRRSLRVTFVLIARLNEWVVSTSAHPMEADRNFEVARLSDGEALGLLTRLERAGELGTLTGLPQEEQIQRLVQRAGRELLVGLREATEDRRFDEIIVDEFERLPNEPSRRAYLAVSTLFQFGVPTRAGILSRVTGIPLEEFGPRLLSPTKGVILEIQESTRVEPTYVARHRVIADVVFRRAFPNSHQRAIQVQAVLQHLDPGYADDARAFGRLINARWMRDRDISPTDQVAVYQTARRLRPGDAFVVQQEALSLRHRDRLAADILLAEAEQLAPNSDAVRHSQATLLLDDAKEASGQAQTDLLAQAERQFRALVRREPRNSAPYVSLAEIDLVRARQGADPASRLMLLSSARRHLSAAVAAGSVTSYVLDMSGRIDEAAGDLEGAEQEFHRAAVAAGPDPGVWINYARFLERHVSLDAAIEALNEAIDLNPIDPQLNHRLAVTLGRMVDPPDIQVRRAFSLAMAEEGNRAFAEADFGTYLFSRAEYGEAADHFTSARNSLLPSRVKATIRDWLREPDGSPSVKTAVLDERQMTRAFVVVPGIQPRIFMHASDLPHMAAPGQSFAVRIGFNFHGPIAKAVDQPQEMTGNEGQL